jgi:hypothetical protein
MRSLLPAALIALLSVSAVSAETFEKHILAHYPFLLDRLEKHGFDGPFADQVARHALMRQVYEDGTTRRHSKSIVGMIPAGLNKEVITQLGLVLGETNAQGLTLKKVRDADGQGSYAIYGPRANLTSAVAIVLLWEKYVHRLSCFDPQDGRVWNQSKVISRKMARGNATAEAKAHYHQILEKPRKRLLKRVNGIYGGNAPRKVLYLVRKMRPIFNLVNSR